MNYNNALKVLGTIVLGAVVCLFVIQTFPGIVGADSALIVQSGSMEPTISTGSVVFVEDVQSEKVHETIEEGDIITFFSEGAQVPTTHRVVEKHQAGESVRFITKGDANKDPDSEPVYRNEIAGKMMFSIPYMGYIINFANTIYGWFVLVILPITALLMSGLWDIYLALEE